MTSTNNPPLGHTAGEAIFIPQKNVKEQSLFHFMADTIALLRQMGKQRTSETYHATLKSFMKFRKNKDIPLKEVDSDLMLMYEAWLHAKGVTRNSSSFYIRILRAVYNRAVEKGLAADRRPFRHVYTGVDKTVKRAVPLKAIKQIKRLILTSAPSQDFARNMFLFSFYTRGMSFVDMAHLQKKDLRNGILTYRRRKTGQQFTIKWEKCMAEIVNKHPTDAGSPYLLPILKPPFDKRNQYRNMHSLINRNLKKVAKLTGLSVPLTLYVARHSWASIAKSKNIPISVISEGMGHDNEKTTQIYLTSLDSSLVDQANRMILKDL